MAKTVRKGQIGLEDLNTGTGTFTRSTSTGGTQTLTQINLTGVTGALTETNTRIFVPGTASGTASAPTAAPVGSTVLSGGSIADGTYYFQITYKNRNGETTVSPTQTVTISGGGGAAKRYVAPGDTRWITGCYGYRVYASNDNVNFYLQTPAPSVADFMTDTYTHYVTMGDAGSKLTSLTFSGTTPPATNTATIDPLQVALNATRATGTGAFSYGSSIGTLFVPAGTDSQTVWQLTTPLIVKQSDHIRGSGGPATLGNVQTRIYSTWADAKLANIMLFGGDSTIEQVGVLAAAGNAVMVLGGAGNQTAYATTFSDSYFRTADATDTYSALILVGIVYDLHVDNVALRGDKAVVEYRNFAGGEHYFTNARWDTGGPHFIKSIPGWTDPDDGEHTAGFPNHAGPINVQKIRTEGGTGIVWDVQNLDVFYKDVQTADLTVAGGTAALMRVGADGTYSTTNTTTVLEDAILGGSANAATGILVVSGAFGAVIEWRGRSSLFGQSTGSTVVLDANNKAIILGVTSEGGPAATGIPNSDPNATEYKVINLPSTATVYTIGAGGRVAADPPWNEMRYRLAMSSLSGANPNRANLWVLRNNAGTFEIRDVGETNINFSVTQAGAGLLRAGLTLGGALSGATTGAFSGQITSTLATGTAPLVVASTTNVANLNASSLSGATFAAPGAIGGGTPGSGAFTTLTSTGKYTNYNGIATAGNGLASEYAVVDLTAQSAAIAATTLYAVPAAGAGQYRISFNAKVTTAATTSSILGGTNGFQIVYTDQNDSVVVTTVAGHPFNSTTVNLALNTTQAQYNGVLFVNAKASTNIQYSIDYTSVGATAMQYNLHVVLEKL